MHRIEREETTTVTIIFEGKPLEARYGDSVAAALLAAGHWTFRTTAVSGTARGPLCMMGVCIECLVEIDNIGIQQAGTAATRVCTRTRREAVPVYLCRRACAGASS